MIPSAIWAAILADEAPLRQTLFDLAKNHIHQQFRELVPLLSNLGRQLSDDYHWAREESMKQPLFVHEAMQRHIARFMIDHQISALMDIKINENTRPVYEAQKHLELSAHTKTLKRRAGDKNDGAADEVRQP